MQETCLIIPCYNEVKRLSLDALRDFVRTQPAFSLLFVNDGSTDGTGEVLEKFCRENPRASTVSLASNRGKAEAVRTGILKARESSATFIGYWDADLSTPLKEAVTMVDALMKTGRTFALASRVKRLGAQVERRELRHYLGRVFSTVASMVLKLPVYDSQCGAKVLDSKLHFLFTEPFSSQWLFDVEVLARFRNHFGVTRTLSDVMEVPVQIWIEKSGSKLRLSHMLRVPLELWRIHRKYNK
jgi:dolichyl-phosphate beta-glucosyltransferase